MVFVLTEHITQLSKVGKVDQKQVERSMRAIVRVYVQSVNESWELEEVNCSANSLPKYGRGAWLLQAITGSVLKEVSF